MHVTGVVSLDVWVERERSTSPFRHDNWRITVRTSHHEAGLVIPDYAFDQLARAVESTIVAALAPTIDQIVQDLQDQYIEHSLRGTIRP